MPDAVPTPGAIPFRIAYAESQDPLYPAIELELSSYGPEKASAQRGWSTANGAKWPQTIGIQFSERSRLTELVLVAHEFRTPNRVEIFAGVPPSLDSKRHITTGALLRFARPYAHVSTTAARRSACSEGESARA